MTSDGVVEWFEGKNFNFQAEFNSEAEVDTFIDRAIQKAKDSSGNRSMNERLRDLKGIRVVLDNQKEPMLIKARAIEEEVNKASKLSKVAGSKRIREEISLAESKKARQILTQRLEQAEASQQNTNTLMWEKVRAAEPSQIDSVINEIEQNREVLGDTSANALIRGARSKVE